MSLVTGLPPAAWWLMAGALLLIVEIVLPGVFLLWFGFAALAVGAILLFTPLPLLLQLLLFAGVSVALILIARGSLHYGKAPSDNPNLNLRGHRHIGTQVQVAEAIALGRGKVQIGDSLWSATGPDTAAGATVRVVAVDGTVLKVEPV